MEQVNWKWIGVVLLIGLGVLKSNAQQDTSYQTIDSLIESSNFEKASLFLNQQEQRDEAYYSREAKVNLALGRSLDALKAYEALLAFDTVNLQYLNALARLEAQRANYRRASQYYHTLYELDSTNAYYLKQLGALSLKRAQLALALAYFSSAYALNDQDLEVISNLAKLYLEIQAYAMSDSLIGRGLGIDGNNASLWMLDCQSAYRQKDYARMHDASGEVLRVQVDSSHFFLRYNGIAAFHIGDFSEAVQCLEKLIRSEGPSELALFYLGMAYSELEQMDLAASTLEKCIDESISKQLGTYHLNLALVYDAQKNYAKAISHYQEAYRDKPLNVINYYLALCYDAYYLDKKPALEYYERYLADSEEPYSEYRKYAEGRISQLKKQEHFKASKP